MFLRHRSYQTVLFPQDCCIGISWWLLIKQTILLILVHMENMLCHRWYVLIRPPYSNPSYFLASSIIVNTSWTPKYLKNLHYNLWCIDSFSKVLLLDFWYRLTIQTNKSARLNNGVRKDVTQFPINIFVFEFALKQQLKI